MTRKERIIGILKRSPVGLTCADITKRISKAEHWTGIGDPRCMRIGNSAVSSILKKLVDTNEIIVLSSAKGPRGGQVYFHL